MFNYGRSYWGTGCGQKIHAEAGFFPWASKCLSTRTLQRKELVLGTSFLSEQLDTRLQVMFQKPLMKKCMCLSKQHFWVTWPWAWWDQIHQINLKNMKSGCAGFTVSTLLSGPAHLPGSFGRVSGDPVPGVASGSPPGTRGNHCTWSTWRRGTWNLMENWLQAGRLQSQGHVVLVGHSQNHREVVL